jgi:AcrR family transcriptional regulator
MLDHPGDAATTLSDANRVSPECLAAALAAQARSEHVARTTLARLNPSLDADPDAAGVRLLAQLGPFVAVARERRGQGSAPRRAIGRARLEALIVPSVVALAATPPAERPAPTPATTWQPQRSRREAILAGARRIFRDRGFGSVGLGDIGEAAGISGATVYHYFAGGKTEILQAAWERETMRLVAGALTAVERAESADDAVDRLARAHVEVMLGCLDLVNVVYRELQDELAPAGVWADNRRLLVDLWAGALQEVRPGLAEAERLALVDMSFAASVQAALAVEGRAEWLDDIARQIAAFAKG